MVAMTIRLDLTSRDMLTMFVSAAVLFVSIQLVDISASTTLLSLLAVSMVGSLDHNAQLVRRLRKSPAASRWEARRNWIVILGMIGVGSACAVAAVARGMSEYDQVVVGALSTAVVFLIVILTEQLRWWDSSKASDS